MMVSHAHMLFFYVDVQSLFHIPWALGNFVEVRTGYDAVQIESTTH